MIRITQDDKGAFRITQLPQVEASLVALDPEDGAASWWVLISSKNQLQHVTQASRQPGSSFKPFIYSRSAGKGILDHGDQRRAAVLLSGTRPVVRVGAQELLTGVRRADARAQIALAVEKHGVDIRILRSIGPSYAQD